MSAAAGELGAGAAPTAPGSAEAEVASSVGSSGCSVPEASWSATSLGGKRSCNSCSFRLTCLRTRTQ
eukprot:15461201-Alexandrium_andersonii.AAC.2